MKNESAVQFETESRIHMGLAVKNLKQSMAFYTTLLGQGLLQETFVRGHRNIRSLQEADRLAAWVYQIARNVVHDHHRNATDLTIRGKVPWLVVLPFAINLVANLALAEIEDHGFALVVLKNRAAQDAVRRRFGFFGKIENVGVGGHACSLLL